MLHTQVVTRMARYLPLARRVAAFVLLVLSFHYFTHSGKPYADEVILRFKDSKVVFVDRFMQNDISGGSDGSALEALCSGKNWYPDRVFSCHTAEGGIASVRQWELQCIRLAIETGASTLILPNIVKRKDRDYRHQRRARAPLTGVPMDYMFDFQHLSDTLAAHCPQMKVYASISDLHDVPSLLTPIDFKTSDVFGAWEEMARVSTIPAPAHWKAKFDDYIEVIRSTKRLNGKPQGAPYRVRLMPSGMSFPVYSDSSETRHDISGLLRFRHDARLLAGAALFKLSGKYGVNVDPRSGRDEDGFAGIHLRIEVDVEDELGKSIPEFAYQASESVKYVTDAGLKVAFLATGGPRETITEFVEGAREFNLTVVTKEMLLEGRDLEQLRKLTYDQQAIVDYEIMKRATKMVGLGMSRFSGDLALVRAEAYGRKPILKVPEPDDTMMWKDEHTTLSWRMPGIDWAKWVKTWWP